MMPFPKSPTVTLATVLIFGLGLIPTAIAQTTPPEKVKPQYGLNFTTAPGAGYNSSFGSFYGWFPLLQNGSGDLFFTEARGIVETEDGKWGGNVALGYRNFASQTIFGSYVGYDVRDFGDWTSHQIGFGLEAVHPHWETRLNGYIPLGDRTATTSNAIVNSTTTSDSSSSTSNSTVSDPTFSGNNLVVTTETTTETTTTTTTRTIRQILSEESLGGFDLEAGTTLTRWDKGHLKGFLGSYLYGGDRTDTFVGIRSRLEAVFSNLNFGVGLESDGEFGTNVIFSIGANFGGSSSSSASTTTKTDKTKTDNLASPLQRQNNIALNQFRDFTEQVETSTATTSNTTITDIPFNNPVTGQPWFFSHVNLDAATDGTGTEENPHNLIATALGIVPQDGNGIIYVEGAGNSPGFTVPANVQVLSGGLTQTLAVASSIFTGETTLLRSNSGTLPTVTSTVSFAGSGELDGFAFDLNGTTGMTAIDATGAAGTILIQNNRISNASDVGIAYLGSSSNVDLLFIDNNTIEDSQANGVRISGNQANTVITNNTISGTTMTAIDATGAAGTILIQNNRISNTSDVGIAYLGGPSTANLTIDNNTIEDSQANGVRISGNQAGDMTAIAITNNTISGTTMAAIDATGAGGTVLIQNNRISNASDVGITYLGGSSSTNLTIDNNTIEDSQSNGIRIALTPTTSTTASAITNNTISNTAMTAIDATGATGTLLIQNNRISNSSDVGIAYLGRSDNIDLTIDNNTIENSQSDAVKISVTEANSTAAIAITNNTITGTNIDTADGIDIELGDEDRNTLSPNSIQATATVTANTIANIQNTGIELETFDDAILTATVSENIISNSNRGGIEFNTFEDSILNATVNENRITNAGGDGVLFLHDSSQTVTASFDNNTIATTGENSNGITRTTETVAGNTITTDIGAGGFGIGVITVADGDIDLSITNNQISNTQDAKIGIAANPAFVYLDSATSSALGGTGSTVTPDNPAVTAVLQQEFAGSSRIDADVRGNTLTGTGAGIADLSALTGTNIVGYDLQNYNQGSFTAIAGNNGSLCVNLTDNTADNEGGSAYQFALNTSPQLTGAPPFTVVSPSLIRGTTSGNSGTEINNGGTPTNGTCN